jgi:hypothetical protein
MSRGGSLHPRPNGRPTDKSDATDDIPGVGPALTTALVASVADPKTFRSGRDFSAEILIGQIGEK